MKHITVGTINPAKIKQIRDALSLKNIEVEGLPPDMKFESIKEDGATAQENARKKALFYSIRLNKAILSMDNALYFDGLKPEQQPGLNVRRIAGRDDRPTDEELTDHYKKLIIGLGKQINGHWEFAFCVAYPDGTIKETTIISPRIFVSESSDKVIPGYPLESLQIDPKSNKYTSEMTPDEQNAFWQKTIGVPLCKFVDGLEEMREYEKLKRA